MILFLKHKYVGMAGIKPGMTGKEADALTRDLHYGKRVWRIFWTFNWSWNWS